MTFVGILLGLIILVGILAMYFLPAIIAGARDHDRTGLIFFLNLFLGWAIIPWFVIIIWSFID